jgi:hypothetical protein
MAAERSFTISTGILRWRFKRQTRKVEALFVSRFQAQFSRRPTADERAAIQSLAKDAAATLLLRLPDGSTWPVYLAPSHPLLAELSSEADRHATVAALNGRLRDLFAIRGELLWTSASPTAEAGRRTAREEARSRAERS